MTPRRGISDFRLPISDCRFRIADFELRIIFALDRGGKWRLGSSFLRHLGRCFLRRSSQTKDGAKFGLDLLVQLEGSRA